MQTLPQSDFATAGVMVVVALLQAAAAHGASGCEQYARNAVAEQRQNLTLFCGFSGPRWTSDYQGHLGWCASSRQDSVDAEANARRGDLANCGRCRNYARDAVNANQQNSSNQCGFTGASWSADSRGHFNWCMASRPESADGEAHARTTALGKCNFCNDYVRQAVTAQQTNVTNACGLAGARWSGDRSSHFGWCMSSQNESVQRETYERNLEAGRCAECTQYSQLAVAAQQQNVARSCGFTGPSWTDNYRGHYDWCWSTQIRGDVGGQRRDRENLLRACEVSAGRRGECDAYARSAVAQSAEYRRLNCDDADERWHESHQNHYGWCLVASSADAQRESAARNAELTRCGANTNHQIPASEDCTVSVIAKNAVCLSEDGTPSTILTPGGTSATGCGATEANARTRAKLGLALQIRLNEGDEPEAGSCTYTTQTVAGCLCR
ncbi:MAG TPA: hypothetical protein VFO82_09770 [Steroidobacteraceae bacterium]|nr:hypothetical protein [Steroidobacteraceae bacterium]